MVRRWLVPTLFATVTTACALHVEPARADVSSCLSVGGGYSLNHNQAIDRYDRATTMSFAVGVGSEPIHPVVVGGLLRSNVFLSVGTDLGLAARIATGGFARGQWGLALEGGPAWRSFGHGEYGRWPLTGALTLGAPWGFQLAVGGEVSKIAGNDAAARGAFALLEVDLLRLTVMRQGATDRWWRNPAPAGGRMNGSAPPPPPPLAGLLW
jgi:hypothetical protein